MKRVRSTLFIVASGLALWALSREISSQSTDFVYTVTEIVTLGGHTNVGLAMSGGGFPTVVGHSQTASGVDHAFSAFNVGGGIFEQLRDLGTLGGQRSEARAIFGNLIVGWAQLPGGLYHAFLGDSFGGPMIDLGTLGGSESWATAVSSNPRGQRRRGLRCVPDCRKRDVSRFRVSERRDDRPRRVAGRSKHSRVGN